MRLNDAHLGYCSNIHPGERWPDHFAALRRWLPAVKARVAPETAMGFGLRLSARAARRLEQADELAEFQEFLVGHDLYVFTVNGFPFGDFHGGRVKDTVYRPDWTDPRRLGYTLRLAVILARLLPEQGFGSISTVPGGYRVHAPDAATVATQLLQAVAALHRLHQDTGRVIALALEPEPGCLIETTADAIAFFRRHLDDTQARRQLRAAGLSAGEAEAALPRHLGLCLDACHAAVMFEDADALLAALAAAALPVHKLQVSAGLRVPSLDAAQRRRLWSFAEDIYLHQTVGRGPTGMRPYPDLPEALAAAADGDELRVHFHVPVWRAELAPFASTQAFLAALLARQRSQPFTRHLEVETYSWQVLPAEYRAADLAGDIAKELTWTRDRLA